MYVYIYTRIIWLGVPEFLRVPCAPKGFDFELPRINRTKLWVETRSRTWAGRIRVDPEAQVPVLLFKYITSKALALIWYRALTWYSSPARPFAALDVPLLVTRQQGSPSPACRQLSRARNACAGGSREHGTKLKHGTKLGPTLCYTNGDSLSILVHISPTSLGPTPSTGCVRCGQSRIRYSLSPPGFSESGVHLLSATGKPLGFIWIHVQGCIKWAKKNLDSGFFSSLHCPRRLCTLWAVSVLGLTQDQELPHEKKKT